MRKHIKAYDGYILVYAPNHPHADANGYVREHRLKAEAALGRILDLSHPVHHFNEQPSDNANTNLVVCEDQKYHNLLHIRSRTVRAGFDPNLFKRCSDHKHYVLRSEFHKDSGCFDGLMCRCKECTKIKDTIYIESRPGYSHLKHLRYHSANREQINAKKRAMRLAGLWK